MSKLNNAMQNIIADCHIEWNYLISVYNAGKIPSICFINEPKGVAGLAYRKGDKVEFNLAYALNEKNFIRTIRHELAHIVQFRIFPYAKQAHGREFRMILNSMGWDSSTYHSYNVTVAKQTAKSISKAEFINSIPCEDF